MVSSGEVNSTPEGSGRGIRDEMVGKRNSVSQRVRGSSQGDYKVVSSRGIGRGQGVRGGTSLYLKSNLLD